MIRFDRYLHVMQQVFSDAYKADPPFQNKIDHNIFHLVFSSSYPITHVFWSWTKTIFFSNCWREGRRLTFACLKISFTKLEPTQFLNSINISGGHQPILSKQAQLKTYNFLLRWLRLWRDFVETNDISSFTAADRSIDRGDRSTLGHWAQGEEEEEEATQVSFKSSIFCFDTPSFPIHNPLVPQQLLSSLNWPAPPPPTN